MHNFLLQLFFHDGLSQLLIRDNPPSCIKARTHTHAIGAFSRFFGSLNLTVCIYVTIFLNTAFASQLFSTVFKCYLHYLLLIPSRKHDTDLSLKRSSRRYQFHLKIDDSIRKSGSLIFDSEHFEEPALLLTSYPVTNV